MEEAQRVVILRLTSRIARQSRITVNGANFAAIVASVCQVTPQSYRWTIKVTVVIVIAGAKGWSIKNKLGGTINLTFAHQAKAHHL